MENGEGVDGKLCSTSEKTLCGLCNNDINDQVILKVDDNAYHQACLRCTDCKRELVEKCFRSESGFLCAADYRRRYGPRCFLCNQPVVYKTPIRHVEDKVCHLPCVRCTPCNRELHTGEKCRLNQDNKLECLKDHSSSTSGFQGMRFGANYIPFTRKSRTIIYPHQLEVLKDTYNDNSKPSRKVRHELAQKTGLETKVVQVWFQNQRAKWRRNAMKKTSRIATGCFAPVEYA